MQCSIIQRQKRKSADTCYTVVEPRKHAQWKKKARKLDTKEYPLWDPICSKCPEKADLEGQDVRLWLPGIGSGKVL